MLVAGRVYQSKSNPTQKAVISRLMDNAVVYTYSNEKELMAKAVEVDAFTEEYELAKCPLSPKEEPCNNDQEKYAFLGPAMTCQGCMISKYKDLIDR